MMTLKHPRHSLPPKAITRVNLMRSASALREMQRPATPPAVIVQHDAAELARLKSELARAKAELAAQRRQAVRAEAAAVGTSLHAAANAAKVQVSASRHLHMERLSHVRDNTLHDVEPEVLITSDAVRARLSLDARTAVRVHQPLLNAPLRFWRGLMRLIWG